MEVSSPGFSFQHAVIPYHLHHTTLPSPSSSRLTRHRCVVPHYGSAPAVSVTQTRTEPLPAVSPYLATRRNYNSLSYKARQSAILEFHQSAEFASAISRFGGLLKITDLNVVLHQYGKLGKWQDLSQLFEWMQNCGKINVWSYRCYIKFNGQKNNPALIMEIYRSIKDVSVRHDVSVCNSVLTCLINSGMFDSGIEFFNQMKRNGVRSDVVTYSTLLSGCMDVKHGYSKALEFVHELEYNGLQMDSVVYGTLLAICASHNRSEEAEYYFHRMKDEGHTPNVFHYSSLLNAYSTEGNHEKANDLVEDIKSAGLLPNKVIQTTLLKVYVRAGLFEKSRRLLSELETLGYAEDEMPYCLLMDALAKAKRIDEAKLIFDDLNLKDDKSASYAHSIMISAYYRNMLLDEAKQLAWDFEAKYNKYDLVMFNTVLSAFCRAGEMNSVMRMMKKMDESSITPNWKTFHILLKYFCKQRMYLLAYRSMVDMHRKGRQPAEEHCSSLIFHLGKIGASEEAFSVYNMLRYGKRTMCKSIHEKILRILVDGCRLKDAYVVVKDNAASISRPAIRKFATRFVKFGSINLLNDVLKALHKCGFKIDEDLLDAIILRYMANPEKKKLLQHLVDWMHGQGYNIVDPSTRELILKNSHLFGHRIITHLFSKQYKISNALRFY